MANNKNETLTMKQKLEAILGQGVELYLDGRPASPDRIAERFVREDTVYMPDFVIGEDGVLIQVRYDKVMDK